MSYKMAMEEIENGFLLVRPIQIGSGDEVRFVTQKKAVVFPNDSPTDAERASTFKRATQEMRFAIDTLAKEADKQLEAAKKPGK